MAELSKEKIKQTTKWTKGQHKTLAMILLIIVAAFAVVWITCGPFLVNQTMIEGYVKFHKTELEIIAMDMIERDFEKGEINQKRDEKGAISIVSFSNRPDMVQFETWGFGLAPSSRYYGFYYSLNDVPIAFDGADYELIPKGDGWIWQQPESDNRGYTEKIMDNWYYYEASF